MSNLLKALDPIISRVRTDITWKKTKKGSICERDVKLDNTRLLEHLDGGPGVGVCPIKEGETTTSVGLLDLDSHKGETEWDDMQNWCERVCSHFETLGAKPVAFRSSGGKGVHIYFIWAEPQDAYSVREYLKNGIATLGFKPGVTGVKNGTIEIFPKQNMIPVGGCGNQFILPLTGKSVPLDSAMLYEPALTKEDALSMVWENSAPVPVVEKVKPERTPRRQRYGGELGNLKVLLDKLDPDCDYDTWVKIGMGLHQESGASIEGVDLFDEWSSGGITYQGREDIERKWDSFRSDKESAITAGFIKNLAENQGIHEDYSVDFIDVSDTPGEAAEPKEHQRPDRFAFIRAADFARRQSVEWLIKGIIPRGANMTYGGSGDGKTFVKLDMAFHIAMGLDWNGHKTNQGRVLYFCAEGAGGFTARLKAIASHKGVDLDKDIDDWLLVVPDTPNFLTEDDVRRIVKRFKEFGKPIDMVIIDTLAQTTAGADENSAKEMSKAFRYIEILCRKMKAAYDLIHHAGKNEERGARGWSGMKAPLDSQIHIYRDGERRFMWVDKMKDGKDGFGYEFALRTVPVGIDADGDVIDSCYVEWLTGTEEKRTGNKRDRYSKWEEYVLKAWDQLGGGNVKVDDVLTEVCNVVVHDPTKKDRRRERAREALQRLADKEELALKDDMIINDLIA